MKRNNELLQKINDILYNDWDPLQLAELEAPKDEYLKYAEAIFNLSDDNIYETFLVKYLEAISKNMKHEVASQVHSNVAKKIVCLFRF